MTTVQQRAIPHLMSGRDVMVKSQTGSGSSFTYMYITVETSGLCEKSAYIHCSIRGEKDNEWMNEESSFRLAWSAYLNTCSINEQPTLYHSSLHKQVKIIRFLYCLLVPVFVSNQKQRFFEGIFFHSMKSLWDIKVLRIRTLSQINHYDKVTPLFSPEQVRLLPLLYQ